VQAGLYQKFFVLNNQNDYYRVF